MSIKSTQIKIWSDELKHTINSKFYADGAAGVIYCKDTKLPMSYFMQNGYKRISIRCGDKTCQKAYHHVLWFLVKRQQSLMLLDHVNRRREDCRIDNLRQVTQIQNMWNRGKRTDGFLGVNHNSSTGMFDVSFIHEGKKMSFGSYADELTAGIVADAYLRTLRGKYHPEQPELQQAIKETSQGYAESPDAEMTASNVTALSKGERTLAWIQAAYDELKAKSGGEKIKLSDVARSLNLSPSDKRVYHHSRNLIR